MKKPIKVPEMTIDVRFKVEYMKPHYVTVRTTLQEYFEANPHVGPSWKRRVIEDMLESGDAEADTNVFIHRINKVRLI